MLYRLALRITLNHEDAEDVVQDTMIKLWNKREQWQQIDNIEAFTTTTCRNLALDKLKKADNNSTSLEELKVGTNGELKVSTNGEGQMQISLLAPRSTLHDNPLEHTVRRDRMDIIRRLVDSLPEKQRSCMQLRDFEGKSYKEIATVLEISEEQVKVNIFRARQTIKKKFQEVEEYGL